MFKDEIVRSTAFRRNFKDRESLLPPKGGTPNVWLCIAGSGTLNGCVMCVV
jgi:hypothetical protein